MLVLNHLGATIGNLPDNKAPTVTIQASKEMHHSEFASRVKGTHEETVEVFTFERKTWRKGGLAFDVWRIPSKTTVKQEAAIIRALKLHMAQDAEGSKS